MKNVLITFTVILLGVFCILSWVDKSDYSIEKQLWYMQKKLDAVSVDPLSVPEQEYDDIIFKYSNIIDRYPHSRLSPKIYFKIAQVYGLKREFDKSREVLEKVLEKYPENESLSAEALLNIGRTYENLGQQKEALSAYSAIQQNYGPTDIGLNMPLYIVNYYGRIGRREEAQKALNEAISIYKSIIRENPQSTMEFKALSMLVTTYTIKESWELALSSLGKILMNYSSPRYLDAQKFKMLVTSINTIAVNKLKSYEKAIDIYQKFIEQYPGDRLNNILIKIISQLNEEKAVKSDAFGKSGE